MHLWHLLLLHLLLIADNVLTTISLTAAKLLNVWSKVLPFDRLLSLFGKANSGPAAFTNHGVGKDLSIVLLFIVINAIVV